MEAKASATITAKGGTITGDIFLVGKYRKVPVRCKHGHEWTPSLHNLVYCDSWCPECYGNKPLTIEDIKEIVEARGGKLLSTEYKGNKTHVDVECANGHQWPVTPMNLKNNGSWCPHCKIDVGEELVRAAFVEAFPGFAFENTKGVPWMEGTELDGVEEELGVAFEYQGKQHAERVEHFQRNEGDFEAQIERDKIKFAICADNWVTLLQIPHTVKYVKLRCYVREEIEALGYKIAPMAMSDAEFYNHVRATGTHNDRQYARACAIAKAKGGEILSTQYVGYRVPMQMRCGKGHVFMATLEAIDQVPSRGPRFCPDCGGTKKITDVELRARIEGQGWTFVSVESRQIGKKMRRVITALCPAKIHNRSLYPDEYKKLGQCRPCLDARGK
jgi:hypothetical protein